MSDQQRASREAGSPRRRTWRSWIAGVSILASAYGVAAGVFHWTKWMPKDAVSTVTAAIVVGAGLLIGGRVLVHLRDGYWNAAAKGKREWSPGDRRRLNVLVALDASIAAGLVACGCEFLISPSSATQMWVSATFGVGVGVVAHFTRQLARRAGLPRGSDTINKCRLVIWCRKQTEVWASFPGVKCLDHLLFVARTPWKQVSGLIMIVVCSLVAAAGANAVTLVVRPVTPQHHQHYVAKTPHHHGQRGSNQLGTTGSQASTAPPTSNSEGPPSYEDLCGRTVIPGAGAPEPERDEIREAWAAIGGIDAACAIPAKLAPGTSDVYYASGYCGDQLRSVAVASPNFPAVVLLEGWAPFALQLLRQGQLLGASPYATLSSGDFHVLYTLDGGYVLIREQVSDGRGGLLRTPDSCFELRPAAEQPVALPPALADLWLRYAERFEWTWPRLLDAREPDVSFAFVDTGASHRTLAVGSCLTATDCSLTFGDTTWANVDGPAEPVTATRVLAIAPH